MMSIVLVRPGCTDFDEQRRIKGSLDIPLSATGSDEVNELVVQLAECPFCYKLLIPVMERGV